MGRALAISSGEAKKVEIPTNVIAIDLYMQCKILEMGRDVIYNDNAMVFFKPANNIYDLASQVVRAVNGHKQIKDYVSSSGIGLPRQVAIANAVKNVSKRSAWRPFSCNRLFANTVYKSRIEHTDTAKWHTAASSKAIDYQQLKTRF